MKEDFRGGRQAHAALLVLPTIAVVILAFGLDAAAAAQTTGAYCTATAQMLLRACGFEKQDDYWVMRAKCNNESEAQDRNECLENASIELRDGNELCAEQFDSRLGACASLGEGRYDPVLERGMFLSDPTHITNLNPYFPIKVGNRWDYAGGTETNVVEVTNETKLIDDFRCLVVRDLVYDEGVLIEATDDWYAQAKSGDVWYCGEEVKNFESFAGDQPQRPELVAIDGRFKADVDLDKAGIIFRAKPVVGEANLEEFSLGNAEDVAEVLSTSYRYGAEAELDRFVPRRLAERMCSAGDCVVTNNFSMLEPGVFERKYYARGIGVFLEVNPDSGEKSQLVNCNFSSKCLSLPRP